MKSVYILIVFGIIISNVFCAVPGAMWNNGEISIQFDDLDATETGLCQSCFKFKLDDDLDAQWAFRFLYRSFFELDSTGAQCCSFLDTGSSCDYGTGCNQHALVRLPPALNVTNATSESISLQGIFSKDSTLSGCTPPGDNTFYFCSYFKFDLQLINDPVNITVGSSVYDLPSSTLKQTLRISDWKFASGSTGLRMILGAGVRSGLLQTTRVNGVKATSTQTGIQTLDLQSNKRWATLKFPNEVKVDGVYKNITVSGPYSSGDPQMPYYYVDFPAFTTSFEYTQFTYINTDGSLSNANLNYCISFVLILSCLFVMFV